MELAAVRDLLSYEMEPRQDDVLRDPGVFRDILFPLAQEYPLDDPDGMDLTDLLDLELTHPAPGRHPNAAPSARQTQALLSYVDAVARTGDRNDENLNPKSFRALMSLLAKKHIAAAPDDIDPRALSALHALELAAEKDATTTLDDANLAALSDFLQALLTEILKFKIAAEQGTMEDE